MKPPSFEYFAPREIEEAVSLLNRYGGDAKVLAGGQSLIPLMNLRLSRPRALVDINRIAHLAYIRQNDGQLAIGGLTRAHALERSEVVSSKCPLLSQAAGLIGHLAIRHRGTIGGNLAHADPASELPAALLALEGEIIATGPSGVRTIPAQDFFRGLMATALDPAEIVTEVRVPVFSPGTGAAFEELSRRHGDFALVGVAALVRLDTDGRCRQARIALCGVGPMALRARRSESALQGLALTEEALEAAAQEVDGEIDPASDIHASGEYRRHVAKVLIKRALRNAWQRAGGGA